MLQRQQPVLVRLPELQIQFLVHIFSPHKVERVQLVLQQNEQRLGLLRHQSLLELLLHARDRFLGLHENSLLGLHITLEFEEYRGERGFAQQRDGIAQRAHDSLLLRRDSGVRRGQTRPTRTPLRAAAQAAASWAETAAAASWAASQGRTA